MVLLLRYPSFFLFFVALSPPLRWQLNNLSNLKSFDVRTREVTALSPRKEATKGDRKTRRVPKLIVEMSERDLKAELGIVEIPSHFLVAYIQFLCLLLFLVRFIRTLPNLMFEVLRMSVRAQKGRPKTTGITHSKIRGLESIP